MNQIDSLFILYLMAVRLATIGAGIAAINYGYRLFAAGVFKHGDSGGTALTGRVGEYELTFKTAAPGSVLALFGASIIVFSVVFSPPEFSRNEKTTVDDPTKSVGYMHEREYRMRGDLADFEPTVNEANALRAKGNTAAAMRTYRQALQIASDPMQDLARMYFEVSRLDESKALAEAAVAIEPGNPDTRKLLGEIQAAIGE